MFKQFCRTPNGIVHRVDYPDNEGCAVLLMCRNDVFTEAIDADAVTCFRCIEIDQRRTQSRISELRAYNTPIHKIIEDNSVKEMTLEVDQSFVNGFLDGASQRNKR